MNGSVNLTTSDPVILLLLFCNNHIFPKQYFSALQLSYCWPVYLYCKTWFFCMPFISQILRPPQIFNNCITSSLASKNAKIKDNQN